MEDAERDEEKNRGQMNLGFNEMETIPGLTPDATACEAKTYTYLSKKTGNTHTRRACLWDETRAVVVRDKAGAAVASCANDPTCDDRGATYKCYASNTASGLEFSPASAAWSSTEGFYAFQQGVDIARVVSWDGNPAKNTVAGRIMPFSASNA